MDADRHPIRAGASLLAMLLVLAVGSGCGGSSGTASDTTSSSDASGRTGAVLEAVDDSEAAGTVLLLPKHSSRPAHFTIRLKGLSPNTHGGQYVLWLMSSRHDMVPLFTYPVGNDGVLAQEWPSNPVHVGLIEEGDKTQFLVTRANTAAEYEETLEGGERAYDPPFIGEPVLRGTFTGPLVGPS